MVKEKMVPSRAVFAALPALSALSALSSLSLSLWAGFRIGNSCRHLLISRSQTFQLADGISRSGQRRQIQSVFMLQTR